MKAASLFTTPAVVAHAHAQLVAWQRRPHRPINRPTDQPCSRGGTDGRGGGTHGDILSRPSGRPSVRLSVLPSMERGRLSSSSLRRSENGSERASERAASFVVVVQRRRCPRQKRPFKRSHCAPLQSSHAHAHEEGPRDHQGDRSPWPACLPASQTERARERAHEQAV